MDAPEATRVFVSSAPESDRSLRAAKMPLGHQVQLVEDCKSRDRTRLYAAIKAGDFAFCVSAGRSGIGSDL